MHLVFRRKLFWVLFALALLSFLFMFGAIYLLATLRQQSPWIEQTVTSLLKDLDGSGTTFLNFMVAQSTVTVSCWRLPAPCWRATIIAGAA